MFYGQLLISTMSFYLQLSPNDSRAIYTSNHGSDFITELYQPLEFSPYEEWEVALHSLTYKGQNYANLKQKKWLGDSALLRQRDL